VTADRVRLLALIAPSACLLIAQEWTAAGQAAAAAIGAIGLIVYLVGAVFLLFRAISVAACPAAWRLAWAQLALVAAIGIVFLHPQSFADGVAAAVHLLTLG